jgi:hypothetical protein
MSIEVTLYKRPHGHTESINVSKIYSDDEQWFKDNNVKLSMEELGHGLGVAAYADVGLFDDDGEPLEAVVISGACTCQETLQTLRKQCERMLAEHKEN